METEEKELELRMYFFVPRNISEIYKGIMCGHASLEYVLRYGLSDEVVNFLTNWKTWVILNGGTTNDERNFEDIPKGTLNQIADQLQENDIKFSYFREPDLNHALTAICFIVDERVFNKEDYPDFLDYIFYVKMYPKAYEDMPKGSEMVLRMKTNEELEELFPEYYREWVRFIGGINNVFLRELLKGKKLA